MTEALLQDRRVLVVEDEYLIAEAMSRGLRRAGATVLGPVSNVAAALALLSDEPDVDAAVLDINLGDQKVYPVVDILMARGAQCVFATGNDPADVPGTYASLTRCEKPVDPECLINALAGDRTGDDAGRLSMLKRIKARLENDIEAADAIGELLLAAKLNEALDVVNDGFA